MPVMRCEGVAERQPHRGPDDAIGTNEADIEPGEVHGAPTAPGHSGRFAVKLGHEAIRGEALGQGVVVATVRCGDGVVEGERGSEADGGGFLAHGRVHPSGYLAAHRELFGTLFETTDQQHGAQPGARLLLDLTGNGAVRRAAQPVAPGHFSAPAVSPERCSTNAVKSLAESTPS